MDESITCRGPCKKLWARFGRSSFLRHIKQAKRCKEKYNDNEIIELEKDSEERTRSLKRQRDFEKYNKDPEPKLKRKRESYDTEARHEMYIAKKQTATKPLPKQTTEETRLQQFQNEIQYGPIFTCICCLRDGFKRSVKKITDNYMLFLHGSKMMRFLQINNDSEENDLDNKLKESLKVFGNSYLCMTCCKSLDKLEMPAICAKNSLEYTPIPACLQIPNLERQLICRDLTFIKVRQLRYGMSAIYDRVINVPIDDDDIIKTVSSLPRTEKNHGMVTVGLKRDQCLRTFHKKEMVSPERVYNALIYLKENHLQYKDMNLMELDEWHKQFEGSDNESEGDTSDDKEELGENVFNAVTCLLPENPLNDVIGNYISIVKICMYPVLMACFFPSEYIWRTINKENKKEL